MDLHRRVRRKLRRLVLTPPNTIRRRLGLARLLAAPDPTLRLLGEAISATANGAVKADEDRWISAIEQVRADLAASPDTYEVRGAEFSGDPEDDRVITETVKQACGRSMRPLWCSLLFQLVRKLRPGTCLELGTCVGISAAYQAAALEMNERGHLITIEAMGGNVALACRGFERLRLGRVDALHGRFEDLLAEVLRTHGPVDLAFIDGNHNERATLRYVDTIKPFLAQDAVVLFDDISFSDEMERAWERVAREADFEIAVDLGPMGLCLYRPGARQKRIFNVPLAVKPKSLDRTWLSR